MNFMLVGLKKMFLDIKSLNKKRVLRQVPNLLTLSRIILLPFIILTFSSKNIILALTLIIVAELTDLLDGRFARKYNLVSKFGAYLDACCDKVFSFSLLIGLFFMIDKNIELLGMVLILELLIMLVNSYYNILGFDTRVNIYGKIKTSLLDVCIIVFYITYLFSLGDMFLIVISFITMFSQIITIGAYLIKYMGGKNEVRRRV